MWVWYFILFTILLMAVIQFINSRRKKPLAGIKKILPQLNYEAGEELVPEYQDKSQVFAEKLSQQEMPFFDATLDLYQLEDNILRAEWSISKNFKNSLSQKYGKEFWHNSQGIFRLNHTNAVPQPYHRDTRIDLDDGVLEIKINSPGETLSSEIGVITETGSFIPLAHSNDVTVPKEES